MRTAVVVILCLMSAVFAQDCKTGGKQCADHEQCCGGCCWGGECIDTYRSCHSLLDVCESHPCVGAESCVTFIPAQCPGCEPIPLCRLLE